MVLGKFLALLAAALASSLLCSAAWANCYVLRNNSSTNAQFTFQYNQTMMPPFDTGVTLFPGAQYPLRGGQWCINAPGLKVTITLVAGNGKPSWSGALLFGASGNDISPSGTYSVN
jgi:hypothetical protein